MPMTVEAILAEVRQLPPEERARLEAALLDEHHHLADGLSLASEAQQMLQGKTGDDFTVPPQFSRDETLAWLDVLRHGMADSEAQTEGEAWDEVLRSIDAARHAPRRLFPHLTNEPE